MLSRVANAIYWMSRYVERAENVARFISVNLNLSLDLPADARQQWMPLVTTTGDEEAFKKRYDEATQRNVIDFLTLDRDNPNSIMSCVTAARENARSVRQRISSEMWEHINGVYLAVRDAAMHGLSGDDGQAFFAAIGVAGLHFQGITDATMAHGEGWHFSRVGRLLERADKTSRILDVKYYILLPSVDDVGSPLESIHWAALLRSVSGFEMYRQRYGAIVPPSVVEFLVLDREFPRAILYCLTQANESLHAITGTTLGGFSNAAEQRLGHLRAQLAYTSSEEIVSGGLHEFVDGFQDKLNDVGAGIYETFFALRGFAHSA